MITIELLKTFCATDGSCFSLPFTIGDFTYATDKAVMLRVPKIAEVTDSPPERNVKQIVSKFIEASCDGDYQPLPELEYDVCGICIGDKVEGKTTCPHCKMEIVIPCSECNGTGQTLTESVAVKHQRLNSLYLAKLATLPNCTIAACRNQFDTAGMMLLRFDGGIGVIMPMRSTQ